MISRYIEFGDYICYENVNGKSRRQKRKFSEMIGNGQNAENQENEGPPLKRRKVIDLEDIDTPKGLNHGDSAGSEVVGAVECNVVHSKQSTLNEYFGTSKEGNYGMDSFDGTENMKSDQMECENAEQGVAEVIGDSMDGLNAMNEQQSVHWKPDSADLALSKGASSTKVIGCPCSGLVKVPNRGPVHIC